MSRDPPEFFSDFFFHQGCALAPLEIFFGPPLSNFQFYFKVRGGRQGAKQLFAPSKKIFFLGFFPVSGDVDKFLKNEKKKFRGGGIFAPLRSIFFACFRSSGDIDQLFLNEKKSLGGGGANISPPLDFFFSFF